MPREVPLVVVERSIVLRTMFMVVIHVKRQL